MLCDDKDERMITLSECSKLAQKEYLTRHYYLRNVINSELCKKLIFDHTKKWYMHYKESVLGNEMHELIWDFEIQTDHLISARRSNIIITNKKEHLQNCGFCCPGWLQNKIEKSKRKISTLTLIENWKKTVEYESDGDTNSIGALDRVTKWLVKILKDVEILGWVETILTKGLLSSDRILKIFLKTWEDLSLKLLW